MEKALLFAERIVNTLRYNGIFIFLALLFPFIIWKIDAGKEIIRFMAEQDFSLNIALSLLTFSASCLSVWCIPTLAIRLFQFVAGIYGNDNTGNVRSRHIRNCLFQQLVNVYNGKPPRTDDCCNSSNGLYKAQLPIRYFAIAPWALFVMSCLQVFLNNAMMIVGLLLIIVAIILLDRHKKTVREFYERLLVSDKIPYVQEIYVTRYKILNVSYFAFIVILFFSLKDVDITTLLKTLLVVLNFLFLLVFYSFILYMENSDLDSIGKSKEEKLAADPGKPGSEGSLSYRIAHINYLTLLIYLIATIITFYFLNQYQLIEFLSPVVVIVTMSNVLIIFIELFFSSQLLLIYIYNKATCSNTPCSLLRYRDEPKDSHKLLRQFIFKIYRGILIVGILVIAALYLFSSVNSHRIRKQVVAKPAEYVSDSLRLSLTEYFKRWYSKREKNDNVVYLISGQGGGSRAAAWFFMNMSELCSRDTNFFKNVFSISTVSGSTSGANMFLAAQDKGFQLNGDTIKEKVRGLYGRNYMSSSFYGLMFGDFIESIFDARDEYPRDRNYHLQKEELAAFERTFDTTAKDFFENDFMWRYITVQQPWPLFFVNSTVVNFGTRAVFSPVTMKDFSIARDLYWEFKKSTCNDNDNIPLITCVNQSQAFPILSAYNHMDCVGRLADAGFTENSGCATTLEIYKHLRKYCDSNKLDNVKFVCLNITNSSLEPNFKTKYTRASVLHTLTAVAHSPFDGSATYAYMNLKREIKYMNRKDTVLDCSLDSSITLTRTMSKQSVDTMFMHMKKKNFTLPNFNDH